MYILCYELLSTVVVWVPLHIATDLHAGMIDRVFRTLTTINNILFGITINMKYKLCVNIAACRVDSHMIFMTYDIHDI